MKKVSVLVATYNHEKYIAQALESIVVQECSFEFEVLVGDDASKDGTAKIVTEYGRKYPDIIKPVIRIKNLGAFKNIQDLFERATGEYIAFLEGDDYWIATDKLLKQVEFLDNNQEYVACFSKCIVVDQKGNRNEDVESYLPTFKGGEYNVKDFNEYQLPGQTATAMYRKKILEELSVMFTKNRKLRPKVPVIDRFLVLGTLSFGKIYTDNRITAAYRFVLDSQSGSWSSKNEGYSLKKIALFLFGLHELERIGKELGLILNYDERRMYEFRKVKSYKGKIPWILIQLIVFLIFLWYNDKKELAHGFIKKNRIKAKK